jgi:hypothetical protein
MLKTKIFHFFADQHSENNRESVNLYIEDRNKHDKEIDDFIQNLSINGHTFVSIDSVGYGRYESSNRVRTIIVYLENQTRKVIVEKNTDND